jgi:CRISPR-associated protein Cst2
LGIALYWQTVGDGHTVNRQWDDDKNDNVWQNSNFDDVLYIDDDVLGFMRAEAAKVEASDEPKAKGKKATPAKEPRLQSVVF